MNKTILAILIIVLAVAGVYALSSRQPASPTEKQDNIVNNIDKSLSVKEVTVTGSNFKFDPAEIRVKSGEKVKITFKNSDGFHDFVLPEFNVSTPQIQSGQEAVVEFTASKVGQYEYYCSVGNHRQMGMVGTLIVE